VVSSIEQPQHIDLIRLHQILFLVSYTTYGMLFPKPYNFSGPRERLRIFAKGKVVALPMVILRQG